MTMIAPLRFGRRLTLPSERQIIHEMRMLQAEEERHKTASGSQLVPPDKTGDIVRPIR